MSSADLARKLPFIRASSVQNGVLNQHSVAKRRNTHIFIADPISLKIHVIARLGQSRKGDEYEQHSRRTADSRCSEQRGRAGRLPLAVPDIFGTCAVLFVAAVLAYAPLIGWGVPEANTPDRTKTVATDEILPLEGLAEMHNTFVVSKPDRNYGYPWFHYFETAVVQTPYLAYAYLTGQMGRPSPDFPFGFRDPVTALRWLTWIGRFLSVLMGAGTVVAAFLFARNLWGYQAGVLTAMLTLLSYPMVYYSRTGNPDMSAAFWSSLGLVAYTLILQNGLRQNAASGWVYSREFRLRRRISRF